MAYLAHQDEPSQLQSVAELSRGRAAGRRNCCPGAHAMTTAAIRAGSVPRGRFPGDRELAEKIYRRLPLDV